MHVYKYCLETRWLGRNPWFLFPGMTLYAFTAANVRFEVPTPATARCGPICTFEGKSFIWWTPRWFQASLNNEFTHSLCVFTTLSRGNNKCTFSCIYMYCPPMMTSVYKNNYNKCIYSLCTCTTLSGGDNECIYSYICTHTTLRRSWK